MGINVCLSFPNLISISISISISFPPSPLSLSLSLSVSLPPPSLSLEYSAIRYHHHTKWRCINNCRYLCRSTLGVFAAWIIAKPRLDLQVQHSLLFSPCQSLQYKCLILKHPIIRSDNHKVTLRHGKEMFLF